MDITNHLLNSDLPIERHGKLLPHWQQGGVIQFVTFRLHDSIPHERLLDLSESKRASSNMLSDPDAQRQQIIWQNRVELSLQKWMDRGHGKCILSRACNRMHLQEAILYNHGKQYHLFSWVIMPNHCHLLFSPNSPLSTIIKTWKGYSAKRIGCGPIWQKGYFDTAIRSNEHFRYVALYIRRNPVGLPATDFTLWEGETTKYYL